MSRCTQTIQPHPTAKSAIGSLENGPPQAAFIAAATPMASKRLMTGSMTTK